MMVSSARHRRGHSPEHPPTCHRSWRRRATALLVAMATLMCGLITSGRLARAVDRRSPASRRAVPPRTAMLRPPQSTAIRRPTGSHPQTRRCRTTAASSTSTCTAHTASRRSTSPTSPARTTTTRSICPRTAPTTARWPTRAMTPLRAMPPTRIPSMPPKRLRAHQRQLQLRRPAGQPRRSRFPRHQGLRRAGQPQGHLRHRLQLKLVGPGVGPRRDRRRLCRREDRHRGQKPRRPRDR